jgi:hypothetical protein
MRRSIREIQDSGKLIVLDDGSKWEVTSYDAYHTKLWMRSDQIDESFGKLTNLTRGMQSVRARRK